MPKAGARPIAAEITADDIKKEVRPASSRDYLTSLSAALHTSSSTSSPQLSRLILQAAGRTGGPFINDKTRRNELIAKAIYNCSSETSDKNDAAKAALTIGTTMGGSVQPIVSVQPACAAPCAALTCATRDFHFSAGCTCGKCHFSAPIHYLLAQCPRTRDILAAEVRVSCP